MSTATEPSAHGQFVPDANTPMRSQVTAYIKHLQLAIVAALEAADGSGTSFRPDEWQRKEGGFGISCTLAGGRALEKAGVNISVVHGALGPGAVKQMRANHADLPEPPAGSSGLPFFAAGLSLVVHPRNPMAPTVHANYRYFEVTQAVGGGEDGADAPVLAWWFGGGSDLTPSYLFEDDALHFHKVLKEACDAHGTALYPAFKRWCDEYFHIPHRDEARGLGGIFFDDLSSAAHPRLPSGTRPTSATDIFAFVRTCGDAFVPSYVPILTRRMDAPHTDEQRRWQLLRRGRYVEFNLVHDRGTKFGLNTPGARIESILMSLPETARWEYCTDMGAEGTEEGKLMEVLRKPKDWIPLE